MKILITYKTLRDKERTEESNMEEISAPKKVKNVMT